MRIVWHVLVWTLVWVWITTVYIYDFSDLPLFLLFNLQRMPFFIAAVYAVSHWVVEKQLMQSPPKYGRAAALFALIFLVTMFIDRVISGLKWIEPTLLGEPLTYTFFNPIAVFKNAFLLFCLLGLAALFQFFRFSQKQRAQIFKLREERLESELAFLRSQVNPHFLFNAFNNLHSLAERQQNTEVSKGLSSMAGLMRYLTYESQSPRVPVAKEVEMIRSFIELQRIRLGNDEEVLIQFRAEGEFHGKYVAPVLLLPLIENAFKHGTRPGAASWIQIVLTQEGSNLSLLVKNKLHETVRTTGGIGLNNLQKRLEIIYPNRHTVDTRVSDDYFLATLTIDLS